MIKKFTAGLAGTALFATMFAGSAFAADPSCTITDNQFALNKCKIVIVNKRKIVQINTAFVSNTVGVKSSTGGNEIEKTNGGDNKIKTGDSTVTVTITNNINTNAAVPPAP